MTHDEVTMQLFLLGWIRNGKSNRYYYCWFTHPDIPNAYLARERFKHTYRLWRHNSGDLNTDITGILPADVAKKLKLLN